MNPDESHELRATNLQKYYGKFQAVHSVSLSLNNGEIVGLLGPNGAGKTTVFYILVGLIKPDNGEIFLGDKNIASLAMHKRAQQRIGYLPQESSIFRKLSVEDNIMVGLEVQKQLNKKQRLAELEILLDKFQLQAVRKTLGILLSGGERRRTEIARTLAINPIFILLDEPFAGVDPISVAEIQKIIQQLSQQKIGLLIIDHNVRETLRICHRSYIMNSGKIIAAGSSESILNNQQVKEIYLGDSFTI